MAEFNWIVQLGFTILYQMGLFQINCVCDNDSALIIRVAIKAHKIIWNTTELSTTIVDKKIKKSKIKEQEDEGEGEEST